VRDAICPTSLAPHPLSLIVALHAQPGPLCQSMILYCSGQRV
jgi:hypothetical protein